MVALLSFVSSSFWADYFSSFCLLQDLISLVEIEENNTNTLF